MNPVKIKMCLIIMEKLGFTVIAEIDHSWSICALSGKSWYGKLYSAGNVCHTYFKEADDTM